ncbi:GNAT family protein [Bacillus sp. REN3]|uniref:GNAT family N-acetyltransferase n=1 Tax=Bacillus sp. REN3 TaxID=2802440 RepID=UPI001AEF1F37|nr:GNAT family protein [Bacillus sp. REN3]
MESPSTLPGDLVTLAKIREEDLDAWWELIYKDEHPEWKKWDSPYFPLKKVALDKFKEQMKNMIQRGYNRKYLIKTNEQIIGMVTYYWEHETSKWLEVGIVIYLPEYWNGGYGTDALKVWIKHLFETFPIHRIGFTTWSGNSRMISVGRKLGMVEEARIRKCRLYNGKYYDSVKMGLLREEWDNLNQV